MAKVAAGGGFGALAWGWVLAAWLVAPALAVGPVDPRIVGGREVGVTPTAGAVYPWFVELLRGTAPRSAYCGGTLISPNHVLTAAHCVNPAVGGVKPRHVLVGPRDLARQGASGVRIAVRRVIRNPDFDPATFDGDVAIIELARPAPASALVRVTRAALPDGTVATVIGFGAVAEGGPVSNRLRAVDLPTVSQAACRAALRPFGIEVTAKMLCAGAAAGGRDACTGDSGGPLFVTGPGGAATQIGVVSFGFGCARRGVPGVYSRPEALQSFLRGAIALESGYRLAESSHTPNQRALATVLDEHRAALDSRTLDAYVDLVLQLDPQRRLSLDSLTPLDALAGIELAARGIGDFAGAIRARLDRISAREAGGTLGPGRPVASPATLDGPSPPPAPGEARIFVEGSLGRSASAPAGGRGARDAKTGHVAVGVDASLAPGVDLGLAIGHARGTAKPGGLGEVRSGVFEVGAYALVRPFDRGRIASLRVETLAGLGWLEHEYERTLLVGPRGMLSRSTPSGSVGLVSTVVATDIRAGLRWTPFAGVDLRRISIGAYREAGAGGLSLRVDPRTDTAIDTRVGLRADRAVEVAVGRRRFRVRPLASAAWLHAHGDPRAEVDARFAAVPGASFRTVGAKRDSRWAELEAGLEIETDRPGIELSFRYRRTQALDPGERESFSAAARLEW